MITLEQFRDKLGKAGEKLSDIQVEEIMKIQYLLADIFFDFYKEKESNKNIIFEENKKL